MGQTKRMSVVSSKSSDDGDKSYVLDENNLLVPKSKMQNVNTPSAAGKDVDFFNDREYYKIFLETSKEQERRVKKNSPFSKLRTWKLMRIIIKTNDDLR